MLLRMYVVKNVYVNVVKRGGEGRREVKRSVVLETLGFDERQSQIPTKEQLGHNYIPIKRSRGDTCARQALAIKLES